MPKRPREFFPDLGLLGNYVIPGGKRRKIQKYNSEEHRSYESTLDCHEALLNYSPKAKVLAFKIDIELNKDWLLTIEFNNNYNANKFKKLCHPALQNIFHPTVNGLLTNYRNLKYFPDLIPIPYSANITCEDINEKRSIVDNFIHTIHQLDPLDIQTIKKLDLHFNFVGLESTNKLIKLQIDITKQLNQARIRGSLMGLFGNNLPRDIGREIAKYINEPEAQLNLALCNKAINKAGQAEMQHQEQDIAKMISGLKM